MAAPTPPGEHAPAADAASSELAGAIERFLVYLRDVRQLSRHTLDGYRHDLLTLQRHCFEQGRTTSGAYGHCLGGAVGLGYVSEEMGALKDMIGNAEFEIEVAGRRMRSSAARTTGLPRWRERTAVRSKFGPA